jgi:hypothetical protein
MLEYEIYPVMLRKASSMTKAGMTKAGPSTRWPRVLALIVSGALISLPAEALRCGTRIINKGDSKPQVWEKCGEPQFREVIRDDSRWGDSIREERWYYPKRTGKLRPVVIFDDDGRVSEIRAEK